MLPRTGAQEPTTPKGKTVQITLNIETNALTDEDRALLRSIAGEQTPGAVIHMADAKAAQEAQEDPAPAPTRSRTRKAAAKAAPAKPEPQADATDSDEEDEDEDLLGGPTVQDAVDRATALVEAEKGKAVKAALQKIGVEKVRNLEGDDIQRFLDLTKKA